MAASSRVGKGKRLERQQTSGPWPPQEVTRLLPASRLQQATPVGHASATSFMPAEGHPRRLRVCYQLHACSRPLQWVTPLLLASRLQ